MEILRTKLGVLTAASDLSAKQYYIAKSSGAFLADLCGSGEAPLGVVQNKPASGEAVELATLGDVCLVVAGENITAGSVLASDANAKAVSAVTGNYVLGVALNSVSAGELVSVLVTLGGKA